MEVQKAVEGKSNNPRCHLKVNLEKEFSVVHLSGYGNALQGPAEQGFRLCRRDLRVTLSDPPVSPFPPLQVGRIVTLAS